MSTRTERLKSALESALAGRLSSLTVALGETAIVVQAADWLGVAQTLRDQPALRFEGLRAVERMRRRGLDVSAFRSLADEPRLLLERSASRPLTDAERELVRRALGAVGYSRATWSDAALGAVQPFLGHPDADIASAAREAASDMAAGAKGDGWRPERRPG